MQSVHRCTKTARLVFCESGCFVDATQNLAADQSSHWNTFTTVAVDVAERYLSANWFCHSWLRVALRQQNIFLRFASLRRIKHWYQISKSTHPISSSDDTAAESEPINGGLPWFCPKKRRSTRDSLILFHIYLHNQSNFHPCFCLKPRHFLFAFFQVSKKSPAATEFVRVQA